MRILVVTNMFPMEANPHWGIFVKEQVDALQVLQPDWEFDVLVIDGRASSWNYLRGIAEIGNRLRQKSYDIVHAHYGLTGAAACFQRQAPLIVTLHGSDVNIPWQRWISKVVARFADSIIVVSPRLKEKLSYCNARIIPCGVNLQLFQEHESNAARRKLGLPQNRRLVLFPGDPNNAIKNYPLLEATLDLLPKNLRQEIQVIPLVHIPRDLMPWYLSAGDVLVMTSKHEGSPMVIKEALACNLPIISTDVGDVKELLHGVKNGYVCPREPQELANHLEHILDSHGRSDGRMRVEELGLSLPNTAQRVGEVYQQVLRQLAPSDLTKVNRS